MAERAAVLELYLGSCPNNTGRVCYDLTREDKGTMEMRRLAMENVQRHLQPGFASSITLGSRFVETPEDAEKIISYARQKVPGIAVGQVELYRALHAVVQFYRKLRIEGRGPEDRVKLAQQLMASGVKPKLWERDSLERYLQLAECSGDQKEAERLKRKLEKLDTAEPWIRALEFV